MLLLPGAALLSKTNLHKIQTKQNHVIRLIFFATLSGKNIDSALPVLNILEMLTVANVYRLHALKFVHARHKGVLPELFNHFSCMLVTYIIITPGMRPKKKIFTNFE